jgi:hypothetical protein
VPFKKGHKFGFTSENPLSRNPVCLKLKEGYKERLLKIPGWQEEVRAFIEDLINEHDSSHPDWVITDPLKEKLID